MTQDVRDEMLQNVQEEEQDRTAQMAALGGDLVATRLLDQELFNGNVVVRYETTVSLRPTAVGAKFVSGHVDHVMKEDAGGCAYHEVHERIVEYRCSVRHLARAVRFERLALHLGYALDGLIENDGLEFASEEIR